MTTRAQALASLQAKEGKQEDVDNKEAERQILEAKLAETREAGINDGLKMASAAAHGQKVEQEHLASVAGPKQPVKKNRGRPKKSAGSSAAAHAAVDSVLGGSNELTEEGKAAKRKCQALLRKLPHRLSGDFQPPADTDAGWTDLLAQMQHTLGEAASEMNVKGLFLTLLQSYEVLSLRGKANPLGWNTSGLAVAAATTHAEMFNDDLVELSILYSEWFSSGPLTRIAGNTLQLCKLVDDENNKAMTQAQREHMEQQSADGKKYKDL